MRQTPAKAPGVSNEPAQLAAPTEPPKQAQEPVEPAQEQRAQTVSTDPQQGVRDALARTNQKIAEADADLAAFSKERGAAAEEVRGLHKKALDTRSTDPERARIVGELNAAQNRLAELNGVYEDKGRASRDLRATRDRLQAALDKKTYDRPSFTAAERAKVWEAAKDAVGRVLSPSGHEIKPGDPWIMGHRPKYEFRKHVASAAKRGISRDQFLREFKELSQYRPETAEDSSSHLYENKTDDYLGP
jgi:chromosome segregation ATPase